MRSTSLRGAMMPCHVADAHGLRADLHQQFFSQAQFGLDVVHLVVRPNSASFAAASVASFSPPR